MEDFPDGGGDVQFHADRRRIGNEPAECDRADQEAGTGVGGGAVYPGWPAAAPDRPGRVLLQEAESLLALSENAVRMARNAAADVLSFQLGATMTAGGYVLPPLAAEFMREHANRRIHLCIANTEEISDKLKKRFFDLALVEGAFDRELFLSRTLLADELLLAGSPRLPFFRGGKVELAELAKSNLPLLLREKGSGTRFTRTGFSGNTASGPSVRGGFWS